MKVPRKIKIVPAILAALAAAGCHLVDQRDFDAKAGQKPEGPKVNATPFHGPPALVTIRFDTPDPDYDAVLAEGVHRAMARKPDVLFTVLTLVPLAANPDAQLAAETAAAASGRSIAASIVADGAEPGQVEQAVRSEPNLKLKEVRVLVH